MEPKLIITADGSHSLYIEGLNEHYHSIHGAIQESKHVFINAGLKQKLSSLKVLPFGKIEPFNDGTHSSQLNILEIGLGTGLNALLTFNETNQSAVNINYTALEAFPINISLASELNYVDLLNSELYNLQLASVFKQIHNSEWEKEILLSENFTINKIKNTLQHVAFNNTYDLIYFDAFGPPVQHEMWTEEMFAKIYNVTKPEGVLVTYCAKGEVKRILKRVGFIVESLPGPPGKREMVRAKKISEVES